MRKDFSRWEYNDAQTALSERQGEGDAESLAYLAGQNWRNGEGWSGPKPEGSNSRTSSVLKEGIERVFTPKAAIPSVVRRFRRGTVGRESGWITSIEEGSRATEKVKKEADGLLLLWWNFNKGLRVLRQAVSHCAAVGRGPLRLYPPPGLMRDITVQGEVRRGMPIMTFKEGVKNIHLLAPKPAEASIVTDLWTMKKAGVYTFEDGEGKPAIGFCYVNEQGKTVFKTLGQTSNTQQAPGLVQRAKDYLTGEKLDVLLDLKGNLLLFELDHEALIIEPVKRQAKLLDKSGTVLSKEMDEDGFREDVYLNTMPPGEMVEVDDPDNPGKKLLALRTGAPSLLERGPGKRLFAQGSTTPRYDKDGNIIGYDVANASRSTTDPVPVSTFIETRRATYRDILEDCDQLHVLISGDSTPSGVSRVQAREDHTKSLEEMKSEVDYVGSEVMETVLTLLAIFAGKPGYFDGIRVSFDARIDPGPLSADERRVIIEEYKEGLRSLESAMQLLGISDPDAMKAKIEEERAEREKQNKPKEGDIPPPPGKPANGDAEELAN